VKPTRKFERNHRDNLITRSVAKAINITNMLFQGIENPDVQQIDDGVNKFPIDTAGNMISNDRIIILIISLSLAG
jgi:hypothetical protein